MSSEPHPVVRFTSALDGVCPDMLTGFFTGWPHPPTPETHLRLLRGTDAVVLALDESSGKVVGYIAALTDGVLTAYIGHLEVLPAWRGRGIGSELVRRMLDNYKDLYMVDLMCDPEVQPFYERLGMRPNTGMSLRNYAIQSGRSA